MSNGYWTVAVRYREPTFVRILSWLSRVLWNRSTPVYESMGEWLPLRLRLAQKLWYTAATHSRGIEVLSLTESRIENGGIMNSLGGKRMPIQSVQVWWKTSSPGWTKLEIEQYKAALNDLETELMEEA